MPSPDEPRELVLYKFNTCPYCVRVMRHVEGKDLGIEMKDTRMDREARAHLRKVTRRTQVPCLFVDGKPLFESADIIRWLDAYAEGGAVAR